MQAVTITCLRDDATSKGPNVLPTHYNTRLLDYDLRSIRLVRVLLDGTSNRLRCELKHADFGSTYTCLSYV